MDKALEGIRVLVTRPKQQSKMLCRLIEQHGGTAIRFPVIEINSSKNQALVKKLLENIRQYDIGIFISRNAVEWTLRLLGDRQSELDGLCLIAIGVATAEVLEKQVHEQFKSSDVIVNSGTNSESLLEIDALSADKINGKKVIIFRGEGGRELLATTLKDRGAMVDYAEVYQRKCPEYDEDIINKIWGMNAPDAIIVTSNNGLQNLFNLLNDEQRTVLLSKQLFVMGMRMLDFSINLGFANPPITAEGSSDEGILKAVLKWAGSKK